MLNNTKTLAVFPKFGSKVRPDSVHIDRCKGILGINVSKARKDQGLSNPK